MNNNEIKSMAETYIINTYGERGTALVRGEGFKVWDADGNEYLDFAAGIAVCNLGHCHPAVTKAIKQQAETLLHVSNLYQIEPQAKLAKLLVENSCCDKAFFCNSGAEANEGAFKLARKYGKAIDPQRYEIITMEQSFHGRTMAAITATGQPKYHEGFEPLMPGFVYVPFNDGEALAAAVNEKTCAIIIEPIQGEGGVKPAQLEFLQQARELCDQHNLLLIFDEVQCGIGRTGKFFAYEHYGVEPDLMTLAKALGNGVPIGAILARGEAAETLTPGIQAATFGGNPLSTAAACATVEAILGDKVVENAAEVGGWLKGELEQLIAEFDTVKEVRGLGLMLAIELDQPAGPILAAMMKRGILAIPAGANVVRFVPPLIITKTEAEQAVTALRESLAEQGTIK